MASIREHVVDAINNFNGENSTLYVLRGFNDIVDELDINFIDNWSNIFIETPDGRKITSRLMSGDNAPIFCIWEQMAQLVDSGIGGIFAALGWNIIVIENDLFRNKFPNFDDDILCDTIETMISLTNEARAQLFYTSAETINGRQFIEYNDIPGITYEEIGVYSLLNPDEISVDKSLTVQYPEEYDDLIFSNFIYRIHNEKIGVISFVTEKAKEDQRLSWLKAKYEPLGVNFRSREYVREKRVIPSDRLQEYLDILHRKNPAYSFRDIKVYENPYENNKITQINQSEIIDEIVTNATKAQQGQDFRDIFVTAPTGAGKSVMFQIPAIRLAEKDDLVTLVITPLIGLMNDQVENIKKLTDKAATINSDYTPIEKEDILNQIKVGEKSILYLSPESLLSNSDIASLIGDRKIGLLVVDEAHIVATWGKSFRPDYWYLGDFINSLRNGSRATQRFPIATFTATATFGGQDNMYQEIIESLKMTPVKYIGNVKRDDISFDIRCREKDKDYRAEKLEIVTKTIEEFVKNKDKALIYFPYKSHISDVLELIENPNAVSEYYGGMSRGEKEEAVNGIKSGTKSVVLATKAFGMGIDIDDIKYVYHFAPTGNIADYVQEIGRAARKPGIEGIAKTDYFENDFRYIKQLYGMSAIRTDQIVNVLKKILYFYKRNHRRNFLVSAEDFSYIFADEDLGNVDSKLKTTLLMIRKDFEHNPNINYDPLVFRPRSMFTHGYYMICDDFVDELKSKNLFKFFSRVKEAPRNYTESGRGRLNGEVRVKTRGDVYDLDFKALWESRYRDMSFASFKYGFSTNTLKSFNFRIGEKMIQRYILTTDCMGRESSEVLANFYECCDNIALSLDSLKQSNRYFTKKELAEVLLKFGVTNRKHVAVQVSSCLLSLLKRTKTSTISDSYNFYRYNTQTEKSMITSKSYDYKLSSLKRAAKIIFAPKGRRPVKYINPNSDENLIIAAQLIELLELAKCEILSGATPQFFVRVNSAHALEKIINAPDYKSHTVLAVAKKHGDSMALMKYFFTELSTDAQRWDFIEKYFLGMVSNDKENGIQIRSSAE